MFSSLRTSKANKELVTQLTNKLNLGAENTIARLAFSYSMSKERKLDLTKMEDSMGKEYTPKVLFGGYIDIYIALVCVHYDLYITDRSIPRYIKMHIDDGLRQISKDIANKDSITGNDFVINEIEKGMLNFENV